MKFFTLVLVFALPLTSSADEPWMYPLDIGPNPTPNELNLARLRTDYVESRGARISNSTSRAVDVRVASFDTIVKWYADKLGGTDLSEKLNSYMARAEGAPEIQQGQATGPTPTAQTILYRFTPSYKQLTIVPSADDADVVVISLLGTNSETSIQVLRRRPHQNGR